METSTLGPVIVASKTDPASLNIAQNLIDHHGFSPTRVPIAKETIYKKENVFLITIEKECIYTEPEDIPLKASSLIFASKHRSTTGRPAFTVHATGNLTKEAKFGGKPGEISQVEPFRIRAALSSLKQEAGATGLHTDISMEATHHGPTSFPVPVCFVEIGSGPNEWSNPSLGNIAAKATLAAATTAQASGVNAVGFGGTHYSPKHTRICLEGDYLIGHLVSKHAFDAGVSESLVQETFRKTVGGCTTAVVDWKGLKGEQRQTLIGQLARRHIEVIRC